jgi:hypothetical protein
MTYSKTNNNTSQEKTPGGPGLHTHNSEQMSITSRGDEVRGIIVLAPDQNTVP